MLNLSNPPNKITTFFNKNLDRILCHLTFQSKPISTSTATTTLVPTHDNIAHLILDQKTATQALQTFKWATTLPNFTHTQSTYRVLIHKLCAFRRFDTVYNLLDEMPSSISSRPNDEIFITIIRGLGRTRNVRDVIKVLDLFFKFYNKKPNVKLYNAILNVLVKEDIDIAREFYRKKMMGCGVEGDDYTYGILMKGLCSTNRIADAFKLLQVIKARDDVRPNVVVYNTLIHGLCKNGKLGVGRARSLMNEMVDPNDVTFNVMITTYCREENLVQALVMLETCFSSGFVPDVITVTKVVDILCSNGRAMEAVEVLERVESKGGKIDVVAHNTLIKGFCKLGRPKVGMRLLKVMEYKGCLPNVETYNTLILGFCKCGSLDSALDLFNEMKLVGISWNFITYDTLIHGLCSGGRMEDGYKILELMEESKGGSKGHVSPYNSIIYGLYKVNRIDEALEFLSKMKILFPRAVDRSLKILGLCGEGISENAKRVYDQMIEEGDIPSILVYLSLIHRFCQEDRVREALEMMNEMIGCGYLPTGPMINVLITALCKNEKIGSASKLLEDMVGRDCLPDSGSYCPLVEALCKKGDFHKALMLFMQMVEKGIVPTYASWNSLVICLCQETTWCESKNVLHVSNLVQRILKNYEESLDC